MKTSFKTIRIITLIILITSGFALAQSRRSSRSTNSYVSSSTELPPYPEKGEDESDSEYNQRLISWEREIRKINIEQNKAKTASDAIPEPPEQRSGESDTSFMNRMRQWETQVRQINTENSPASRSFYDIPETPVRRTNESDAAFQHRLRDWEVQVRQASTVNPLKPRSSYDIPKPPEQRPGESDDAYKARFLQWEAAAREQAVSQKKAELLKVEQDVQKVIEQVARARSSLGISNPIGTDSDNMLVIPSGEIETEELLTINEDLNIMSRIFSNELQKMDTSSIYTPPWESTFGITTVGLRTGRNLNTFSSMYLQDYGALFQINVNFPLSVLPEIQDENKLTEEIADSVWNTTRQQIYEPQASARKSAVWNYREGRETTEVTYNPQQVENLKTSLIQALKHASNIRALQPDESVILRISEMNTLRSSIIAILGDQYYIAGKWVKKEDLPDSFKLSPLTAIVIRVKKSHIDAFAKDELDFDAFREKVQVFSYPLLSGNPGAIR